MDEVDVLVALALLTQLERARQVLVDRVCQALDLLVAELGRELERRELRAVKDLVRVRAPDAGERALVAQQRVELPVVAREDLAEPGDVEPECVRPEVGQIGVGLLRRLEPDAGALLLSGLGEDELASVLEAQPEHRRLRAFFPGEVAQPAGAHQVDAELELAVRRREEELFAAPPGTLEAPAVELPQRRVERLQRRDVRRPGLLDRRAGDERGELAHPRLDLGQLGHELNWALRRSSDRFVDG